MLDIYKIGVGPSSSHTVGPMRAASAFIHDLLDQYGPEQVDRIETTLYGSLSLTGLGHGTDRAVIMGLEGADPATVNTDRLAHIREIVDEDSAITIPGPRQLTFIYERDIVFEHWLRLAPHPNGMRFKATDARGTVLLEEVWYSVGGGTIERGRIDDELIGIHAQPPAREQSDDQDDQTDTAAQAQAADCQTHTPYPFHTTAQLLAQCRDSGLTIAQLVMANEVAHYLSKHADEQADMDADTMHREPADEAERQRQQEKRAQRAIRNRLLHVWDVMKSCVQHGCSSTEEELPGGLHVKRRAPAMHQRLAAGADVLTRTEQEANVLELSDAAWVNLFALAVSEENAGGGRVVTAPTNGSAGIVPAVLHYYWHFVRGATKEGVIDFLLTAAAIGYLFRTNASISGAEVGCQGEVGVACSMAAAGLCAVLGGTPEQIENAAEIGIEHHLGLTCDPVAGLVQIPCIERNAMASNTAINAVRMTLCGDGSHMVGLDAAIRTMRETGEDMLAKYKETSQGGLALHVVEC
ncbi:L-serine dehydratase [Bifidobacterium magnum]|uniref:L-serine dehydratase n=1 Tax=Bifidobacterium magnum TaxID=1692 RepID=A0A087BCE1_9BIFI|nr:L-serine dehydratase [Bifidobacterium magnum]